MAKNPNKLWLEIERLSNKTEAQINKELEILFKDSLEDLSYSIGTFMAEHPQMSYAQMMQVKRMESMYKQIDDKLTTLTDGVKDLTYKADLKELEYGYFGEWYNIENQAQMQFSFGFVDENKIKKLIEFPVNGIPLSDRLYKDYLLTAQKQIKSVLEEGLIQGYDNRKMAKRLSEVMQGTSYKKAKTIIRTESGRINSLARMEAQETAASMGIQIQKKWISTLDRKTRVSHQHLDGQIVGKDEMFTSRSGAQALQPRTFGVPAEDINCRCGCTSIVNGYESTLRRDKETKQLVEGNYMEWFKKNHKDEYEELYG